MNEEQTSYKVTDRRLFNPDGTPRDVPENEKPEPAPAKSEAASAPESSPEPPASVSAGSAPDVPAPATTATEPETSAGVEQDLEAEDAELGAEDPASFASFMMSIASNAASSLGMMEHPVTHKREVDLELGKHWIDVLGMLERKTRGNLSPQEQQILEGLLADLRMQYVSLTNAAPKARTFTSQDITGG
ncbi:MAG TPA: DUF1844 domain-containing protein [Pyrinomonadaceae bacterium]|jgi:hypothetical protein|nr:DUF1844 domain-containing protein [Pyrinomonadaceae bacterium]